MRDLIQLNTIFMKKILLLALVLASAFVSHAEITGYRSIVFHRTNGTALAIAMEDDMTVNLENGNIAMACSKGTLSVAIAEMKYWTYSKQQGDDSQWSGIESIVGDAVNVVVSDNFITIQNLPENSNISLVAMDGRVVAAGKASGSYEIAINGLTTGVYVLTYNNNAIKIAVK